VLHGNVGVLIGRDFQSLRARLLDERQRLVELVPERLAANLQVEDVDGNAGFFRQLDGGCDLRVDLIAFAADV
jgi:hypothetical protein